MTFIQGFWKDAFHWKLKFSYNTEMCSSECLLLLELFIEKDLLM